MSAILQLKQKRVLLVGGGKIAYGKLLHLLEFEACVTLLAPTFSKEVDEVLRARSLPFVQQEYTKGDIAGFDIVVVATNDIILQQEIYKESRELKVLFSCVDILEYCDFIFGSYIKKGDLVIDVSTGGVSPALAKELKHYIGELLPSDIADFLNKMRHLRETLPKSAQRMELLRQKAKEYISSFGDDNE